MEINSNHAWEEIEIVDEQTDFDRDPVGIRLRSDWCGSPIGLQLDSEFGPIAVEFWP